MKKWTLPSCYVGQSWPNYYVFLGQHRDSDALTRSNFRVALERLGGETGEDDNGVSLVTVVRESHWAVGWVEWIAIHESNTAGIALAEEMEREMEGYPVLDESDWSRLEDEECEQVWTQCFDAHERAEYLRKHSYTAGSLADVFQAVRSGSWEAAANMLHSPSDILY